MWYYVYILELKNGKHYTGCTVNLKERYARHKKGFVPSTKPHLLLKLDGVAHSLIDIGRMNLNIILNPALGEHLLSGIY